MRAAAMGDSSKQLPVRSGSGFYGWIIQMLYSRRRGYISLQRKNSRRRRVRFARLGGRRFLKLKRFPRFSFRWLSPFALLAKLRDAYVDCMLGAASSRITATEYMAMGSFAGVVPGRVTEPFGPVQLKEYNTKKLVELHRSIAANQAILSLCT